MTINAGRLNCHASRLKNNFRSLDSDSESSSEAKTTEFAFFEKFS